MTGNSRPISTNQDGPHEALLATVAKHQAQAFAKPIACFNADAVAAVAALLGAHPGHPWILDSGCGVGESTRRLARRFPDHLVIGVDRSASRLQRQYDDTPDNAFFVRADLVDFWRLAAAEGWTPARHYLLYPNPYPKKSQLKQRWHAHPVFPAVLQLGGYLECRSNWLVYLQEMTQVLAQTRHYATLNKVSGPSLTPFERKYRASGQTCWALTTDASQNNPPRLIQA